jgi:hypothetical protein
MDAVEILANLTPEKIRTRLDEIKREARALRVLLRSARARHDGRPDREQAQAARRPEVGHER